MDLEHFYENLPAIFTEPSSTDCPFEPHDYIFRVLDDGVDEVMIGTYRLPTSVEWLQIKDWAIKEFGYNWQIDVYDSPEFVSEDEESEKCFIEGEVIATLTLDTGIS